MELQSKIFESENNLLKLKAQNRRLQNAILNLTRKKGTDWLDFEERKCPVSPETIVSVRYADRSERFNCRATDLEKEWKSGDIVAFRIDEETFEGTSI